jgi:hypothetical protein
VTGAISRPSSHAGARFNLFRFASSDGFYPQGCDANTAFEVCPSPREGDESNILKFSIVFQSLTAAAKFVDKVGSYLRETRGVLRFCSNEGNEIVVPPITPIAPYPIKLPKTKFSCCITFHVMGTGRPVRLARQSPTWHHTRSVLLLLLLLPCCSSLSPLRAA